MTTTTLTAARLRIIQDLDLGDVLPNGATGFSAVSGTTLTAAYWLADTNKGGNNYLGWGAFRPTTATAADAWRLISTVVPSTGVATISGVSYTDTTLGTETLELYRPYGIRPDWDILNALNQALEFIYFQTWEPFSLAADAAGRASDMSAWGTAVQCTAAKQTTASRVYPGFIRSFAVTGDSSHTNGYQPTANIAVEPNEPVLIAALGRTNSGTGNRVDFYDVTNAATFDAPITFTSSTWKLAMKTVTAPAGCYNINVRLGGQGVSDVTDWQALWVLRPNAYSPMVLPASYADEQFKIQGLAYSRALQGSTNNFVYEGVSMSMAEIPATDYSTNFMAPAANPMFIQFHNRGWWNNSSSGWLNNACLPWLELRLPYSERATFAAETDTTTAPLHLLAPAAEVQLLAPAQVRSRIARGDELYAQAQKDFADASRMRTTNGPAKRTPYWRLPTLVA